jgi:ATP-dependent protease ClpP protease subunit
MVRLLLREMRLYDMTTHEDRLEIDREIERRTGLSCDEAIEMGLISRDEFLAIVNEILRRRKRGKEVELYV